MKFSKINQVVYPSAPISIPNMKALAQILFEISCTQDFQILFSKGHNSEKRHNLDIKKNTGQMFLLVRLHEVHRAIVVTSVVPVYVYVRVTLSVKVFYKSLSLDHVDGSS